MAYFNYFIKCIIRNIARLICKPRNFLIIFIVCIILAVFSSSCFAADETTVNPTDQTGGDNSQAYQYDDQFGHLYTMQYSVQERFIANCYSNKGNSGFNELVTAIFNETKNLGLSDKTLFVSYGINNTEFIVYYTYSHLLNTSVHTVFRYGSDEYNYSNLPVCSGQFTQIGFINAENNNTNAYVSYSSINQEIPYACLNVFNPSFIDLFRYYGLITDEASSELESLNSKAEQTNQSLNIINSTIDQGNQLQQEQNDFLKNDNVSVDTSTLPSDTTQDITDAGFNSIFQQIYNTFTGGSAQDIVITIPFTNKSFTINANTVYGGSNLGFIRTLIESFWYFVISYFIVKDIGKKINKIKSGDIEHVQEDNIKEDLL